MRRLLLLLGLLLLLPLTAWAVPYDAGLSIHAGQLNASQRALLEHVRQRLWDGEQELEFAQPVDYDDLCLVMNILFTDFPELTGLSTGWSITYYRNEPDKATGITVTRLLPMEAQGQVLEKARQVLAGIAPCNEASMILSIHDAVCMMTDYDGSGTLPNDAWGPLMEGRAVCEGYSDAMVLLCRLAGITCSEVTGTAENGEGPIPHAWVMFLLDGSYTQTDVTWDDHGDWLTYDLYQLSDGMMAGHIRDELSERLPACTREDLSWHSLTGNLMPTGSSELRGAVSQKAALLRQGQVQRLRFSSQRDLELALDLFRYTGGFTYYRDDVQLCLTIFP